MYGPLNVKFICIIFEVQGSDEEFCKLNCLTIEYGSKRCVTDCQTTLRSSTEQPRPQLDRDVRLKSSGVTVIL